MKKTDAVRLKRKMRRMKPVIGAVIALAIVVIVLVVALTRQSSEEVRPVGRDRSAVYELTETDIFALDNWDSRDISVMGVLLRDDQETVIGKLGAPDKQTAHPSNVVNMEYSSRIGLNDTGLILHFENDVLKRITVREPFNEFLKGQTKVGFSKDEMFALFGSPDDMKFVPIKEGSALVFRDYVYAAKGLEIFIRRNDQIGFALFV